MSSETLFDPSRLPPRDESGAFHHPDLDRFEDPHNSELLDIDAIAAAGFDVKVLYWEHEDPDAYEDHCFDHDVCANWQPDIPDGWQLVALFDTEDGPAALMVRGKNR